MVWAQLETHQAHLQTRAMVRYTLPCEPTGNPVDFENTAALQFPFCAVELKPICGTQTGTTFFFFIEENKVYSDAILNLD